MPIESAIQPPTIDRGPLGALLPTLEWVGGEDGHLRLIDQTALPLNAEIHNCRTVEDVWEAIHVLRVRGAPAIGVAAAYGLCLGTRAGRDRPVDEFHAQVGQIGAYLCGCRPTAVNLAWAVRRLTEVARAQAADTPADQIWQAMLIEAHRMAQEDADTCRRIGEHGADLVPSDGVVVTHCNAGSLATVAYGTALAPLYIAQQRGRRFRVYADETRPLLQGARITSYELDAAGIDVTVLCDSATASLMKAGGVSLVITGADRIAGNGDVANKIGTYALAIAARYHKVPFYVAAPLSTFDRDLASGAEIPIEERPADEIGAGFGRRTTPQGVKCWNPAFDVTPAELVAGMITEQGLVQPVNKAAIDAVFAARR